MKIIKTISWKSLRIFQVCRVSPSVAGSEGSWSTRSVMEGGRRQHSCGVWAQLCEDARTDETTGPRPHLLRQDTSQASPVTTQIDFPCMEPTFHYAMSDSDRLEMPLTWAGSLWQCCELGVKYSAQNNNKIISSRSRLGQSGTVGGTEDGEEDHKKILVTAVF